MSSSRLPGKVLEILGHKPVLSWVIDRVSLVPGIHEVVVATSHAEADDDIVSACAASKTPVYRGSEHDVLGRFVECARHFNADLAVRVNADNPFIAPECIQQLLDSFEPGIEYMSFRRSDGTPAMLTAAGFFAEVVSRECLERANEIVQDPFQREHVTLGIYTQPEEFSVAWAAMPEPCETADFRLTLDNAADLVLLREIYESFGVELETATAHEIAKSITDRSDWKNAMRANNTANPKTAERAEEESNEHPSR